MTLIGNVYMVNFFPWDIYSVQDDYTQQKQNRQLRQVSWFARYYKFIDNFLSVSSVFSSFI